MNPSLNITNLGTNAQVYQKPFRHLIIIMIFRTPLMSFVVPTLCLCDRHWVIIIIG